jgi:hypothetical protein
VGSGTLLTKKQAEALSGHRVIACGGSYRSTAAPDLSRPGIGRIVLIDSDVFYKAEKKRLGALDESLVVSLCPAHTNTDGVNRMYRRTSGLSFDAGRICFNGCLEGAAVNLALVLGGRSLRLVAGAGEADSIDPALHHALKRRKIRLDIMDKAQLTAHLGIGKKAT